MLQSQSSGLWSLVAPTLRGVRMYNTQFIFEPWAPCGQELSMFSFTVRKPPREHVRPLEEIKPSTTVIFPRGEHILSELVELEDLELHAPPDSTICVLFLVIISLQSCSICSFYILGAHSSNTPVISPQYCQQVLRGKSSLLSSTIGSTCPKIIILKCLHK